MPFSSFECAVSPSFGEFFPKVISLRFCVLSAPKVILGYVTDIQTLVGVMIVLGVKFGTLALLLYGPVRLKNFYCGGFIKVFLKYTGS